MSLIDNALAGAAGIIPPLFAQQVASVDPSMAVAQYGVAGAFAALALWALRNESRERLDDNKQFADRLAQLAAQRLEEAKHYQASTERLLLQLLERADGKKE